MSNGQIELPSQPGIGIKRRSGRAVLSKAGGPLHGTVPAVVTPLADGGSRLDQDAIGPYADFLAGAEVSAVMTLGTTGEGILLHPDERKLVTKLFIEAGRGRFAVAAHCGAQTTADSVRLAEHAAAAGADAISAIGPPYFRLDAEGQRHHLRAIAEACAPVPFYVYELEAAAGYPFDREMLARLRDTCANVVGIKVSDTPWESFSRYLLDGFDVLVGPEAFIHDGIQAGAVGAISALAAALPGVVADVVRRPTEENSRRLGELRARIDRLQRHAALKRILARQGVPIGPDVRPPLRDLDAQERRWLDEWLARELG